MLIAAVMPIMVIYQLPHGQLGYSGHILNLPQNVTDFATSLPRSPSDIDVLIVQKQGADGSHRDFRVRRHVVQSALEWLISHNLYYRNIALNRQILQDLPEDAILSELPTFTTSSQSANEPDCTTEDHTSDHLQGSFIPVNPCRMTEQQTVRQSVMDRSHHPGVPTVTWPQLGDQPINEFNTEGYMSCAFPSLYPTGAADFNAPRERQVTIGYYFKHMMLYRDGRFACYPRFHYFALNTEMRWRALQAGKIYVRQNPHDERLTVEELREMIGDQSVAFSNRVLHFATTLRGTRAYWFKQRMNLIAMIDFLGLPILFFTHSAADLQWPELASLICPDTQESIHARREAVALNPAVADWFFYERIRLFMKTFYIDFLGCSDYWMRFEWQHRGSPHVHGLAWLHNAPDVEMIKTSAECKLQVIQFIDNTISTINPAIDIDGSNQTNAPMPQTNPHICNVSYNDVEDYEQDLIHLIATCQRHTRCSAAYCLRTNNGP